MRRLLSGRRAATDRALAPGIYALGFGVSLMVIVIGIDRARASRINPVTVARAERPSRGGARALSGGHDGRLAGG